jgi:hypothetical protein
MNASDTRKFRIKFTDADGDVWDIVSPLSRNDRAWLRNLYREGRALRPDHGPNNEKHEMLHVYFNGAFPDPAGVELHAVEEYPTSAAEWAEDSLNAWGKDDVWHDPGFDWARWADSPTPPPGFDPMDAGERWDDEY